MFELVSIEYISDARLQVRFVGEEQGHEVNELIKVEIFRILVNYVKSIRDTLFIITVYTLYFIFLTYGLSGPLLKSIGNTFLEFTYSFFKSF